MLMVSIAYAVTLNNGCGAEQGKEELS